MCYVRWSFTFLAAAGFDSSGHKLGLRDWAVRGVIASQSKPVWPSRDKPRNFSLALKKSMLSVRRLVVLPVFWVVWSLLQLSKLLLVKHLDSRGTSQGPVAIGVLEDAKSLPVSGTLLTVSKHNSKLGVPEDWEFLRESLWSGTSRDRLSESIFGSGIVKDLCPWGEVDRVWERTWREAGDWGWAMDFVIATLRWQLSAKFCSGTTVVARERGRVESKGYSHGCSEFFCLVVCVDGSVWLFSVPSCELLIDWNTLFTERLPLGLCCWLCGSERLSIHGLLHTGSCCSDRSLSE